MIDLKNTKKTENASLSQAMLLLLIGLVFGSLFTCGSAWKLNVVTADECMLIETQFTAFKEFRKIRNPARTTRISIDCADGKTYEIVYYDITNEVENKLPFLQEGEELSLLVHPVENRILELTIGTDTLITFDDTQETLKVESYFTIGIIIFLYFCALLGLFSIVLLIVDKSRAKKKLK